MSNLKLSDQINQHDWRSNGVDIHKGEYWYKCAKCGASDWTASYDTMEQIVPA